MLIYIAVQQAPMEILVASLTGTANSQAAVTRDLPQPLGIEPNERGDLEKLPGGELRLRAGEPIDRRDTSQ
jgi:antitoxin PrlF